MSLDEASRGRRFGEVAELYDAARPDYLPATVDAVLAYADPGDRPVLEVGAGTGKATVAFAARGLRIVCVEPDERMAAVLRRKLTPYRKVTVEVTRFEDYRPPGRAFGLLYAAASWHWVDPERRWSLAHAALAPGAAAAILGCGYRVADRDLLATLTDIDERHGLAGGQHAIDLATPPASAAEEPFPEQDLGADPRLTDVRHQRLREPARLTTTQYVDYLTSVSIYRLATPDQRYLILTEIAQLLDASSGGGIDLELLNILVLARTAY